ncbi:hypothetical protein BpHYR1_005496 [Brachionus plicatilis]|uniref:Uncharacterized protein n=1 Tax=Brachionus plicatilis TaxID=10195 RepID=A0A3M7PAI2_BRAPC|nr:hypothetical protein BpHYR1_005496 [Brachionus plicatilis]
MAMATPVVSLTTQDVVNKALSKHLNPVPCPTLVVVALADFAFDHSKNFIVNDCFEAIYCLRTNSIN